MAQVGVLGKPAMIIAPALIAMRPPAQRQVPDGDRVVKVTLRLHL